MSPGLFSSANNPFSLANMGQAGCRPEPVQKYDALRNMLQNALAPSSFGNTFINGSSQI